MEGAVTPEQKLEVAQAALQRWVDQQGHERCWYYPDIFNELVQILEVKQSVPSHLS